MIARTQALQVDPSRMMATLDAVNHIGRQVDGSCRRLALSDEDKVARDFLIGEMRAIGLQISIDPIGNIVGLLPGGEGRPVMSGSHVDTVATGGRFDGLYGIVAALECLRTIRDLDLSVQRPVAVAIFTNEEGARFQPDMMGSLVYAGGLPLSDAYAAADVDGCTVGDELRRIGYCGADRLIIPHAFVELHIEQGPILDSLGEALGAVENLQAIEWIEVTLEGISNHAGTCPMAMRCDAGYGAARIAVEVRDLVRRIGGSQVGTVGQVRLSPNLVNVIARRAVMTIDMRNTSDAVLAQAMDELRTSMAAIAAEEGLTLSTRGLASSPAVAFDELVLRQIEAAATEIGCPIRRMTSGAGHDAQMLARICPTAMIFVPSIGGVSHNPREDTSPEHLELGANMLLRTMLKLAS